MTTGRPEDLTVARHLPVHRFREGTLWHW
jgi:hypothetical protein